MTQVETIKRAFQRPAAGTRPVHGSRHRDCPPRQRVVFRAVALTVLAGAFGAFLWHESIIDSLRLLASPDWIAGVTSRYGPIVIVALMVVAVVASPVPSGPIAMAAGALYGTLAGGCLTAAGAFCGAMIAFGLSRRFGHRALRASSHPVAFWIARPRSQNRMMLLVMASRLVPFISFDAVSYCAGLTRLHAWRFAIATFLGVIPASFAFAALGAGIAIKGMLSFPAFIACAITLIFPIYAWIRHRSSTPRSSGEFR
ncbi:TVP38/TMEM64 family protein [Roseovarius sp. D22-M7]|uniref:TVP38/TMEM64 family protein n=1 Tax=Roseovarius sp. D22-M7 TaxID=3127116 RepID=UPI0030102ACA